MKVFGLVACSCALGAGLGCAVACGEQPGSTPDHTIVYKPGRDVAAPELQAPDFSEMISKHCEESPHAKVVFSMIVDETGRPRRILFEEFTADDLDRLALYVMKADQFKPGLRAGNPVAVKVNVEVKVDGCAVSASDRNAGARQLLRLKSQPLQRILPFSERQPPSGIGKYKGLSAPYPIHAAPVRPTNQAFGNTASRKCMVTLTVDENGLPEDPVVSKSLDPSFDRNAVDAVLRNRFFPAMKAGEPVAARITIGLGDEIH